MITVSYNIVLVPVEMNCILYCKNEYRISTDDKSMIMEIQQRFLNTNRRLLWSSRVAMGTSSSNTSLRQQVRRRRRRHNDLTYLLLLLIVSNSLYSPNSYFLSNVASAWQQRRRSPFYYHKTNQNQHITTATIHRHINVHCSYTNYHAYLKQGANDHSDGDPKIEGEKRNSNTSTSKKDQNEIPNSNRRKETNSGTQSTKKQRSDTIVNAVASSSSSSISKTNTNNNGNNSKSRRNRTRRTASNVDPKITTSLLPPPLHTDIPSKGTKKATSTNINNPRVYSSSKYESSGRVNNLTGGQITSKTGRSKSSKEQKIFGKNVSPSTPTTPSISPLPSKKGTTSTTTRKGETYTSLLPPYIPDILLSTITNNNGDGPDDEKTFDDDDDDDDFVTTGLSSWEQFLSRGPSIASANNNNINDVMDYQSKLQFADNAISESFDPEVSIIESVLREFPSVQQQPLPSINDLFPPDLTAQLGSDAATKKTKGSDQFPGISSTYTSGTTTGSSRNNGGGSILDGILPVSDLFYRSSQAQYGDDEEHDDEELPFSAEQSDSITSDENKVRVRQNMANKEQVLLQQQQQQLPPKKDADVKKVAGNTTTAPPPKEKDGKEMNRKMIRRGMEMLVGGVPIQADPPQRSIQITYNPPPKDGLIGYDWASTISLNTREFGPLLHTESIPKVSDFERGLFCEYFCHATIKWDVCPSDLRKIVNSYKAAIRLSKDSGPSDSNEAIIKEKASNVIASLSQSGIGDTANDVPEAETSSESGNDILSAANGEIRFEIGISREELETGSVDSDSSAIFRSVFDKAFHTILERAINASTTKRLWEDVDVEIPRLTLQETDDGYTSVCAEFKVDAKFTSSDADRELRSSKIGTAFSRAMDDGSFAIAIAAAAKEEIRWPEEVRNRVVEECLFQDDDGDESAEKVHWTRTESPVMYDQEVGLVIPARLGDGRSSLYKGGGDDGVFYDFSAMNALNAPYSGELGLRLVDAVTERAKQRHPKVIAIGDVHGCIDELQDLLRQCDFRPGDLVVFLGDLVCKGPDSIAVVQMAREIGAIAVRGNHDFEVVRWHQAIKSGVDPPVFGSEHYHIAACLSKADMNWMHSLPWYISSKDLGTLFVHAGFVSGIRLAKQNPRLMMNMRSILPDGTVTSKFFNNWPWARLWDGPQTVLFGHDADRGLQQYEHAIGLDTGCVYGGRLTACILPEKKLVSVSAKREYFKYRRKHYD